MPEVDHVSLKRRLARLLHKWLISPILVVLAVRATLILVHAFASRNKPDLETWHRRVPEGEFTRRDLKPGYDLARYLQVEQALDVHGKTSLDGGLEVTPAEDESTAMRVRGDASSRRRCRSPRWPPRRHRSSPPCTCCTGRRPLPTAS